MAEDKFAKLKKVFADNWEDPQFSAPEGSSWLQRLGAKLYGSDATKDYVQSRMAKLPEGAWTPETLKMYTDSLNSSYATPFNTGAAGQIDFTDAKGVAQSIKPTALGNTAGIVGANIKAHPWATAGTALNTGMGLAGLFDNDKFGGQLVGTALGAAIPAVFDMGLSPFKAYNVAALAGNLGALFDNLRAKKEREQAYAQYQ
jgi:hypothetical protein